MDQALPRGMGFITNAYEKFSRTRNAAGAASSACAGPSALVDSDHHVGRLDHRVGLLALFELEFVDRFVGDRRGDDGSADVDAHMGGGLAFFSPR